MKIGVLKKKIYVVLYFKTMKENNNDISFNTIFALLIITIIMIPLMLIIYGGE